MKDGKAVSECKELKEAVLADIKDHSKKAKLHSFEIAKAVYLRSVCLHVCTYVDVYVHMHDKACAGRHQRSQQEG